MATCFCGCGREIDGLRPRANNEAAKEIARDLAVLEGALSRGDTGARTAEAQALADEGTTRLAAIRSYLHGEVERDALDKRGNQAWMKTASKLADTLVASASGPSWEPDDPFTAHLAQAGLRAVGVVTDVRRDGLGNERVADLAMTVSARTPDGETLDVRRSLSIAVVKAPRVGDRVEIAYDPDAPDRFVYRPALAPE